MTTTVKRTMINNIEELEALGGIGAKADTEGQDD